MTQIQGQEAVGVVATALCGESKFHSFELLLVAVLLILITSGHNIALAEIRVGQAFTIEQRVACQTIIEEIRWSHRIWPVENKAPKPPRTEILSDAQIRTRVEDYLRMEAALEALYGVRIDSYMLQSELNRMVLGSKAPDRLQELFDALGNSPVTIAECLARPQLARRKLYNNYVWDNRYHGDLRDRVETALADLNAPVAPSESDVQENLLALVREDDETEHKPIAAKSNNGFRYIELEPDDFEREVARLTGDSGRSGDAMGLPSSTLRETEVAFVYEEVLSQTDDRLEVRSLVWQKQGFNTWWASQPIQLNSEPRQVFSSSLHLPVITGAAEVGIQNQLDNVTADSWVLRGMVPTVRTKHTTIWTGSEMIIWGGYDGSVNLNTGGRYDPVTNSWTATNSISAPGGRNRHTAIWSGSEMIVWGGHDGLSDLNTGGRYDPVNNSWTATSTDGAPSERRRHTAIWSGSEMIVWGGYDGSNNFNTGGRYDPVANSWTVTNTDGAPSERRRHTAIWSGSEMIVWGGWDGSFVNTGGRYDPVTNSWTTTSTNYAPSVRDRHTAIWSSSEMIIWGGYDGSHYLNSGGRYDPVNDSWTATNTSGVPSVRRRHTAIWTDSEMIVWGGYDGLNYLNSGGRYDPVTNRWTATSTSAAPSGRSWHTAIWSGNEMIVWGGLDGSYANSGGRYDPVIDNWMPTSTNSAPSGRDAHTAIWSGNEMIVWGGHDGSNDLNTGGCYDPVYDSWTATNTDGAPSGRKYHTAIWSGSEMVVWGGHDGSYANTGGRYDPATDSWKATNTSDAPIGRADHTAIWSGSRMIVWGGYDPVNRLNSGGLYDPVNNSWTPTNTNDAPVGRSWHTAIWTDSKMIVWGGVDDDINPLNTGGRYDPVAGSWISTNTNDAPSERHWHTAIWSDSEMIIWGGYDGSNSLNTGGRYDPVTDIWAATNTSGAPSRRSSHTAIWSGSEMIIWGGSSPSTRYAGVYYPYVTFTVTPAATTFGSINPSTAQMVNSGETTSFTISPDPGFDIREVNGCDGTLDGNTYTTGPIIQNCTIFASFLPQNTSCTSGNVTLGPTTYFDGDIIAEQAEGYLDTNGDVILESGATVIYEATTSIELNPGFHALTDSVFSAMIRSITCTADHGE